MIELTLWQVLISLLPVVVAGVIYGVWVDDWTSVLWATLRMFLQLIAIGYALSAIFGLEHPVWVLLVVAVMATGAGWIALRPIRQFKQSSLPVFVAVIVSGLFNLAWILTGVIQPTPWYNPAVVIPLAGMVLASSMNAVSLCAERFWSETRQQHSYDAASKTAMTAAMIPQINSLLAVGLVSLPGMMTGQILSGVSPLIAVRYQIVIMAMVLSTAALGSFIYLRWVQPRTPQ